jgi:uncharacterized protein YbbK (DUF523 family)
MSKKVLISSCLLGENVKYDGGNNSILDDKFIQKLKNSNLIVPSCPETEGGLPTPRVPVEIINKRAINQNGEDKTAEFVQGAKKALQKVLKNGVKMAIMKFRSPSCGSGQIYDGTFTRTLIAGDGIATRVLKKNGVRVFTEFELDEAEEFWETL